MGQKVNPVVFRLGNSVPHLSSWYTDSSSYSHLLSQDLELRSFLSNVLKTRGILVRSCLISRTYRQIVIDLDLYFSYSLSKQSKFLWARSLFKTIKEKYIRINRIKDVKNFVLSLDVEDSMIFPPVKKYITTSDIKERRKLFLSKFKKQNVEKNLSLRFKNRLFFFLIKKKNNRFEKTKEDIKVLSIVKNLKNSHYKDNSLIRLNSYKFGRLFVLKKFRFNFKSYYLKKTYSDFSNNFVDLLQLNKNLCKSIQNFCGVEEVKVNLLSNQLNYLPSFKFYQKKIFKELILFQKTRDLNKYFVESLENIYFVTRTFGVGNAYLLSSMLVFLLENTRKQIFVAKFFKKSLQVFFQTLPSHEVAIDGVKILIKGRFNKRRRTKKVLLQEGQISLQTIKTPIDYYQTQAVTIYGTFGIKVWISKRQES